MKAFNEIKEILTKNPLQVFIERYSDGCDLIYHYDREDFYPLSIKEVKGYILVSYQIGDATIRKGCFSIEGLAHWMVVAFDDWDPVDISELKYCLKNRSVPIFNKIDGSLRAYTKELIS